MRVEELTDIFGQRPENFAWLLGAGASRSSGLPTATDIIWYLKLRYYCREENQDIDRQDVQLDAVKTRIQAYMDSKGFPSEWAPEEYSTYFEKIFGGDRERQRKFLAGILKEDDVRLSVGNRVFGALLSSDYCRAVFTTNFDSVVEKAVADVSGQSLAAFHLEGPTAANNALNNGEYPIYCKLHGDFRYDSIKNLSSDLVNQNRELSNCLINAGNRFGFIISGYSGRDESIMELFDAVLETNNPFPHGLYWTGLKSSIVPPAVKRLLQKAKGKGVQAEHVEVETFDTLMLRLWRNIQNKPKDIDKKVRRSEAASANIPLPEPGAGEPLIRMNALPITHWTTECLKLDFRKLKEWRELRDAQRNSEGSLIFTKAESVWCWGTASDIRIEFGDEITSLESDDVQERFINFSDNLHFQSFFLEGVCRALVKGKPLLSRSERYSSYLIVDAHSDDLAQLAALFNAAGKLHGEIPGLFTPVTDEYPKREKVTWSEAVRVSIDQKDGRLWLLLDPDIWIWPKRARRMATSFLDKRKGDRRNDKYNSLLSGWVQAVLGTSEKNIEIVVSPFESGSSAENPSFTIGTRTGFSERLEV